MLFVPLLLAPPPPNKMKAGVFCPEEKQRVIMMERGMLARCKEATEEKFEGVKKVME